MYNIYKHKYNVQKLTAKKRNIDWHFTYESWIDWWGDDIVYRGKRKGQLCMARYNDSGPYSPENVRKATTEENATEAHYGKPKTTVNGLNSVLLTCPHCDTVANRGNAKQWHFDNCKQKKEISMGKGSRARPFEIPRDEFESKWDAIFGKKDKEKKDEKPANNDDSTKTK